MKKYDHKKIEKKWREKWEKNEPYKAEDFSKKEKSYLLIEFPYPSGDGLHVGHPRPYIGMDIIARKRRAEGYNVLYPIGWDAFGLPTENYALKTGIHPKEVTKINTDIFRKQIKMLGISFDWSREINTTNPEYYKWTQWIFLQFFKKGLAYRAKMSINWCLSCKIGLANEEVVDGKCERCGGETEKRDKEQWMLAITKYADRLDKDLNDVNYSEPVKIQQRNWIGKSSGATLKFKIKNLNLKTTIKNLKFKNKESEYVEVFTTRPDTLFGVTYMVLAPEHKLIRYLAEQIENFKEVEEYIEKTKKKTEIERISKEKEKTGVELKGIKAINPATKKEIPIFTADYIMAQYGTGAIMAVPAHDKRDYQFAKKFKLPIVEVISGEDIKVGVYEGEGKLINSGKFDGMESEEARKKIAEFVEGAPKVVYKLRDWVFSRQRYWGEPIPIIHCKKCGIVSVLEEDLPVILPEVKNYKPTNSGESPLAKAKKWVNVKCPKCGGEGKRETDVMPNWAGSSWYYLAYALGTKNLKQKTKNYLNEKVIKKLLNFWIPVDWYNGGMEHTTLHLLYSRFWHKFLYDIKMVPTAEPYMKRTSHGLILAENGEKMSKSRGNVINPDDIVENIGADSLRLYEMFMGPFNQAIAWNTDNMIGVRRFLEKIWKMQEKFRNLKISVSGEKNISNKLLRNYTEQAIQNPKLEKLIHQTIKKVSEDIEEMKFNTAISAMMIFANELEKEKEIQKNIFAIFLILLAPFAPHIAEELWEKIGNKQSILFEKWPEYNSSKITDDTIFIAVQINGKIRATIEIASKDNEEDIKEKALLNKNVKKWTENKNIKKVLYVKNKIISIATN